MVGDSGKIIEWRRHGGLNYYGFVFFFSGVCQIRSMEILVFFPLR